MGEGKKPGTKKLGNKNVLWFLIPLDEWHV